MTESAGPTAAPRQVQDLSWDEGERLSAEQQALHPARDRIMAWAEDHQGVFAGLWLDNTAFLARTGPVRIGVGAVHGAGVEVAQALLPLVGDPQLLQVVERTFCERALWELQDEIVARYLRPDGGPVRVTGVGVDVQANLLTVMLNQPDPDLEARLRAECEPVPVRIEYGELRSLPLELDTTWIEARAAAAAGRESRQRTRSPQRPGRAHP